MNVAVKYLILHKILVLKQNYTYVLIDFTKNSEDVLANKV